MRTRVGEPRVAATSDERNDKLAGQDHATREEPCHVPKLALTSAKTWRALLVDTSPAPWRRVPAAGKRFRLRMPNVPANLVF